MAKDGGDGLVVDIVDDQPDLFVDTGKKPEKTDEKAEKPAKTERPAKPERAEKPDAEDWQARLDAERARATAESKARVDAEERARAATDDARVSKYNQVLNGIVAAKSEADSAQREYQKALEDGEYSKAAELQRKMSRAEASLIKFEEAKADIEHQNEAAKTEKKPDPKPTTSTDPFEAYVGQFNSKTQAWFRAHPEFVRDAELNHMVLAADVAARKKGHVYESPEYFQFIEDRMGLNADDDDETVDTAADTKTATKKPMTAAPVSREAPASKNGVNGTRVSLTRAEVEIAEALNMSKEEYAKFKLKAINEGRYEQQR